MDDFGNGPAPYNVHTWYDGIIPQYYVLPNTNSQNNCYYDPLNILYSSPYFGGSLIGQMKLKMKVKQIEKFIWSLPTTVAHLSIQLWKGEKFRYFDWDELVFVFEGESNFGFGHSVTFNSNVIKWHYAPLSVSPEEALKAWNSLEHEYRHVYQGDIWGPLYGPVYFFDGYFLGKKAYEESKLGIKPYYPFSYWHAYYNSFERDAYWHAYQITGYSHPMLEFLSKIFK